MLSLSDDLSCQELVELVTEYLEDALDPAERTRFEAHLRDCAGCQTYLDQMQHTLGAGGGDAGWEADIQQAPGLAVLLPWAGFASLDAGVGEQERGGEVVPHPVAEEVADLQGIPRRVQVVSVVGGAGAGPAIDGLAVGGLKNDPFGVGVEGQAPAGRGPGGEDRGVAATVGRERLVQ